MLVRVIDLNRVNFGLSNIPESVNWTANGAVNLPKDQGTCGGGWSFATTLEGSYFLNIVSLEIIFRYVTPSKSRLYGRPLQL